ncbi:hypothetical protein [Streptomyces sp. NPDC020917]|uniref:hypothetical protein n=1 Tax=Streptomyces sp. NPDC020917 TaxID=3365102 RepID=UPI0037A6FCEB
MADEFGPTTPAEPDPIDERLRQLARDTEPLVILAGPAAARGRGERRTARRRTAAVGAVAALALGIGSWQLLPRLGGDGSGALPAATVPAPTSGVAPAARLQAELLPPSALPMYPKLQWEAVPDPLAAAKYPETCPVSGLRRGSLAEAGRVYRAVDGTIAHYHLYAMPSDAAARDQWNTLDVLIKAKCGWAEGIGSSSAPDRGNPWTGSEYRGLHSTVMLERRGTYIALLDLSSAEGKGTDGLFAADPWPGACINGSLGRLAAADAPTGSALAGGSPSAPAAPTGGSASGAGADTAADPSAGKAGLPDPNATNHC